MRADAVTDVERPWMELVERCGVIAARDELLERSVSASQAAGIAMWLGDQLELRRNCSEKTASSYRRTLSSLGDPPRFRIGSGRAIPGYVNSSILGIRPKAAA